MGSRVQPRLGEWSSIHTAGNHPLPLSPLSASLACLLLFKSLFISFEKAGIFNFQGLRRCALNGE